MGGCGEWVAKGIHLDFVIGMSLGAIFVAAVILGALIEAVELMGDDDEY